MSEIKSVQCANFTAALGETFRFCTLDGTGRPCGQLLTGKVQKIRRAGRKWSLTSIFRPRAARTHTMRRKSIITAAPERD